jgi:hypothetical protein
MDMAVAARGSARRKLTGASPAVGAARTVRFRFGGPCVADPSTLATDRRF